MNTMHSTSGMIGAGDADIIVSLDRKHRPTADYVRILRKKLPQQFPGVIFYFLPADIITQILNFGLPAPIDVQIEGADIDANRASGRPNSAADPPRARHRRPAHPAGLRLPQLQCGCGPHQGHAGRLHRADVAGSMLSSLSGSFQTSPMFFLNWRQRRRTTTWWRRLRSTTIQSLQDLQNIPFTAPTAVRA